MGGAGAGGATTPGPTTPGAGGAAGTAPAPEAGPPPDGGLASAGPADAGPADAGGGNDVGPSAPGPDAAGALPADAGGPPPGLKRAIMAAGYGALRLVSFDGGKTWKNRVVNDPNGGDDTNLIRAVAWVGDRWVAAGWKIFVSLDGVSWQEIDDRTVPGGWYDCVTHVGPRIIVKTIRADRGGQNGGAIESSDGGKTWKVASGPTTCHPPKQPFDGAGGATLRSEWKGKILRSLGGRSDLVHQDCCSASMFAEGFAVER